MNGARYYVTGDTQPLPEMAATKPDVIFPLLSGCGGNTEQALKMAGLSGARFVVPVHHGGQVETIKKYVARLPEGVQSAYYLDGKLNPRSWRTNPPVSRKGPRFRRRLSNWRPTAANSANLQSHPEPGAEPPGRAGGSW